MSTAIQLHNTPGAAQFSLRPSTIYGGWANNQAFLGLIADTTAAPGPQRSSGSSSLTGDVCLCQWVGNPLQAQTILSQGWTAGFGVSASSANFQPLIFIGVISGDTGTLRGTILARQAVGTGTRVATETQAWSSTLAGSQVICQAGDTLVIEIGLTLTAQSGTVFWDGTTSINTDNIGTASAQSFVQPANDPLYITMQRLYLHGYSNYLIVPPGQIDGSWISSFPDYQLTKALAMDTIVPLLGSQLNLVSKNTGQNNSKLIAQWATPPITGGGNIVAGNIIARVGLSFQDVGVGTDILWLACNVDTSTGTFFGNVAGANTGAYTGAFTTPAEKQFIMMRTASPVTLITGRYITCEIGLLLSTVTQFLTPQLWPDGANIPLQDSQAVSGSVLMTFDIPVSSAITFQSPASGGTNVVSNEQGAYAFQQGLYIPIGPIGSI